MPLPNQIFHKLRREQAPPYDKPGAAQLRALCLLNHHSVSAEPLACDVVSHFTDVKCECGIISTRHVHVQTVRQNEHREGACPFRIKFFTTFGGSKPPPYDKPDAAQLRALCLLNHNSVSAEPLACDVVSHFISLLPFGLAGDGFVNFTMH